jgi:hypothetical protein
MMSKLGWYVRQLFPLTYRTFYLDAQGLLHFAVWKMWFGRCYRVTDVFVDCYLTALDDTIKTLRALYAEADTIVQTFERQGGAKTCLGSLPLDRGV